ncbi:MAG: hypothetical protein COZ69_14475 [Deltaproteobacteria bacterium CG_4_8_14_3_um_filter_45_9]|nr:MAG: hypothetical protein COZ69_14475 [Deltaproteobacteria bacterium CG_4_8_14_3_um_filter_45_9]
MSKTKLFILKDVILEEDLGVTGLQYCNLGNCFFVPQQSMEGPWGGCLLFDYSFALLIAPLILSLPSAVQGDIVRACIWGTSYIDPVKRENEKILSFIKTASYKTLLILGTLFPLNPMTDLP